MKLAHQLIETNIDFRENKINVFVVENQNFFRELINELVSQINGCEGRFVLSDNLTILPVNKNVEIMSHFTPFENNKKTLITKLHNILKKAAVEEDFFLETQEVLNSIRSYLYNITEQSEYAVEVNDELDITALFKAVNLRFSEDYKLLSEQVLDYMLTVRELEKDKLFVAINLKTFLSFEELELFYKTIIDKKLKILFLENTDREKSVYEDKLIIDEDYCEI